MNLYLLVFLSALVGNVAGIVLMQFLILPWATRRYCPEYVERMGYQR